MLKQTEILKARLEKSRGRGGNYRGVSPLAPGQECVAIVRPWDAKTYISHLKDENYRDGSVISPSK